MAALLLPTADVSPSLTAGLLLAAQSLLRDLNLPRPSGPQILDALQTGRTQAYEKRDQILQLVSSFARPSGRPKKTQAPPVSEQIHSLYEIRGQALKFLATHPGAMSRKAKRRSYSSDYARFAVQLCTDHGDLELASIADAIEVPVGTLKDWRKQASGAAAKKEPISNREQDAVRSSRIETIVFEWQSWSGKFADFCEHLKHHLRVPVGRTFIRNILEALGARVSKRRQGRSPDEKATRDLFETFFAGAQWEGDGTTVSVTVDDKTFAFNLELMVDAHTGAFTGASIRDEEDSQAVIEAFEDSVETTGASPEALLLDNKIVNHTDEVDKAIGDTLLMRSTKSRPQSKPHVEGGFGLFKQRMPELHFDTEDHKELASQILKAIIQTLGRGLNRKPRKDRDGRSRVDLYRDEPPTPEQVKQAKAALEERARKQQRAFETTKARQDPVARKILEDAFERLGLLDPKQNIRAAIARYPLDFIVAGIAIFEGKRSAKTLPDGVDARYLLGIVKNVTEKDEGLRIADALWRLRLDARDQALTLLQAQKDTIVEANKTAEEVIVDLVDRAMATDRRIDRLFWIDAVSLHINHHQLRERHDLYAIATRRIHSAFAVHQKDRLQASRILASKILPLQ